MIAIRILIFSISALLLYASVWSLWVFFHFKPKYCSKCKGFLRKEQYFEKRKVGSYYSDEYTKDWLDSVYVYKIDGKEYSVSGGAHGKKGSSPCTVDIVYQTKNPKRAYVKFKRSSPPQYWVISVFTIPFFVLFLLKDPKAPMVLRH